jgi:hypothetical protein
MGDWTSHVAAGEGVFLVVAFALFLSGCRAGLRARRAKRSFRKAAAPWLLACFSLVFVRHWALEQEFFRGPAELMQKQAEKVPETVAKLQEWNDWIFHNAILVGIPAAFLLGFLFHMAAAFTVKWVFRLPIFVLGCAGLFVLHQVVTKKADGVAEAVGNLWSGLKSFL